MPEGLTYELADARTCETAVRAELIFTCELDARPCVVLEDLRSRQHVRCDTAVSERSHRYKGAS
jgi:hypothetical protein